MGAGAVTGEPDAAASTEELVELVPADSRVSRDEGFAAFMASSQVELLRTAWLLVGDAYRAEELTQRALVRTYGAWPRAQRDPLAYTRRVLVNLRTDTWRRRRREVLMAPERLPDRGRADDGGVEQRDELSRALGVLTARQRRVVVLRYLLDLPEAEVAAGRRRLSQPRWVVGAGSVAAAMVIAVAVMTAGWLPGGKSIGLAGTTSPTACVTAPTVEYTAPGRATTPLSGGATATVTAAVGEPVTVRFVGDCAAGGRLSINGTGPGETNASTGLWNGQTTGSWTPTEPGTRTLAAAWACTGSARCPLATLGYIRVITQDPRTTDSPPPSQVTPEAPPAGSPGLEALAAGTWHLTADTDVGHADRALASALVTFALDPTALPDGLAFAPTVALGTGATIEKSLPAAQLNNVAAWDVAAGGGYGLAGPFNALDTLAARIGGTDDYAINGGQYGGQLSVHLGTHPGCPDAAVDVPTDYAAATQVWISPADGATDSCIDWFAVNLFVDGGAVRAVTVQLGSP